MKELLNKLKNNKKVRIALVATAIVAAFFGGFFAGAQKPAEEKAKFYNGLEVTVVENKIEVNRGTSDASIIDAAKYAVSAKYNGEAVNSKELQARAFAKDLAKERGEFDYDFAFTYKGSTRIVTLHYTVIEENNSDASNGNGSAESSKKAEVNHSAVKSPIKKGEMAVKGAEGVYVDTKGFHNSSTSDVKESTVENTQESELVVADEEMTKEDVDSTFGTSDEQVDEAIEKVEDATSEEEIKVDNELNEAVDNATSEEKETEVVDGEIKDTPVKPTAKLIVVKLSDGTVLNLTSNLSGNVDDSVRLMQNSDGSFIDMATGSQVDFQLGQASTKIVDGFGQVTVYNTNAGLFYLS